MATYNTTEYAKGAKKNPESGITIRRIAFTLTSGLAQATSDTLKVCKIPKGVVPFSPLTSMWSSNDPDDANTATLKLDISDGTTTKNVIASGNFQAADTPLTGTFTLQAAIDFWKTDSSSYYAVATPGAGALDSGAQLKFCIAYLTGGDQGDA